MPSKADIEAALKKLQAELEHPAFAKALEKINTELITHADGSTTIQSADPNTGNALADRFDRTDCALCGEALDGDVGEMHDPSNPDRRGIVHAGCGLDAGWVIS